MELSYFLEDQEEDNLEEELEDYEEDENFELILSVDSKDIDDKVKQLEKLGIKVCSVIRDILPVIVIKINKQKIKELSSVKLIDGAFINHKASIA